MKLLTVADVAERLKCNRHRVHALVKKYKIKWTFFADVRVMTEKDLKTLIKRQSQNGYKSEYHKPKRLRKG
jgi:hypothetical protein